jgi:hypothetical protein
MANDGRAVDGNSREPNGLQSAIGELPPGRLDNADENSIHVVTKTIRLGSAVPRAPSEATIERMWGAPKCFFTLTLHLDHFLDHFTSPRVLTNR